MSAEKEREREQGQENVSGRETKYRCWGMYKCGKKLLEHANAHEKLNVKFFSDNFFLPAACF